MSDIEVAVITLASVVVGALLTFVLSRVQKRDDVRLAHQADLATARRDAIMGLWGALERIRRSFVFDFAAPVPATELAETGRLLMNAGPLFDDPTYKWLWVKVVDEPVALIEGFKETLEAEALKTPPTGDSALLELDRNHRASIAGVFQEALDKLRDYLQQPPA